MKQFNTVKELREAYEKHLGIKVYDFSRSTGISSLIDFGVEATVEYVDGFGWAIV